MAEGECFQWKYLTPSYMGKDKYGNDKRFFYSQPIKFSARYVRITSQQIGLKMNEVIFPGRKRRPAFRRRSLRS